MPAKKIHILSPKAREECKRKIAEQNPSLEQGTFVYAADGIPIAMALGNGQFRYLGPLADKNNTASTISTLKKCLLALGIIDSESASIDHLTVPDEQPSVAASNPPAKHTEISGIQKDSAGFCFLPDDAREIKAEMTKRINNKKSPKDLGAQRYLLGQNQTDTSDYVSKSLNSKPVYFLDFIKILNALIEKNLVTLKEGITIETLLELPEVDENNPLELLKEDIHFRGNRIFLSETARDQINGLLFKKKLDMETLVSENNLNKDTLRRFLKGTAIHKNSFLTILNLLANQGVIQKPETSFQDLLSNATQEQEEGLTAATNTTTNCMASNGTQPAAMVVVSLSENGVATR